jgi:hypothetical protein
MSDGAGDSSDKSHKAESEASNMSANEPAATPPAEAGHNGSADNHLPVIWSPKLDASEAEQGEHESLEFDAQEAEPAPDEAAAADSSGDAGSAAPPRSFRFVLLAATIALAAALGSFLGTIGASGIGRLMPSADGGDPTDFEHTMKAQLAELNAVKVNVEAAARNANTQFAKIADRLDRVEHAEADPAAKIAHIADTVDRLDKRMTNAGDLTGSIASPPAADQKIADRTLDGWVVQDVQGGRALIENRNGGMFDVGAGSVVPGLGHIDAIKRQDGQWVVLTARGMITQGR